MSTGYQPQPMAPVPTGAHTVTPRQQARIVGVRESFEATFGGYTWPEWVKDAECAKPDVDPNLFYPTKGGVSPDDKAKKVCGDCPVRELCLEDAIEWEAGQSTDVRRDVYGTRGGMTQKERRRLVQQRRVAAKRQDAAENGELRDRVVADYVAGQLQVNKIAAKHGVAISSVTRWAQEAQVPMRPRGGGFPGRASRAAGAS